MTSNRLSTSNTTELDFSETEKKSLKKHIIEKMSGMNVASSMSLGGFFNCIEIPEISTILYSIENISAWNTWVRLQKKLCIEGTRRNASKMPGVYMSKVGEFFQQIGSLGLLDSSDELVTRVNQDIEAIITKNPIS